MTGLARGRIAENQIVGALANGIDIQADEKTDVALDIDGNIIRQSTRIGISAVGFPGTARMSLAIRNNHITLSQRDGVILALYGGSMLATLGGNEVTAPVGVGFLLTNFSPGVFTLEGDPTRTAQDNLQRSNTGSAGRRRHLGHCEGNTWSIIEEGSWHTWVRFVWRRSPLCPLTGRSATEGGYPLPPIRLFSPSSETTTAAME
jgi:hypothetical protein